MECTEVLTRWFDEQTALSCIAELRPGPAVIHLPSCRLALEEDAVLRSDAGSAVVLPELSDATVETDWRGTKLEITYAHATVVVADYSSLGTRKEVLSH